MAQEQYIKYEIEKIKGFYTKADIPYIYDAFASDNFADARASSLEELFNLLDKAVDIRYFSDEDCFDGGVIEEVAYQFDKKLPSDFDDEDFDIREYESFILRDEETTYYVFFLDSWPAN